MTDARKTISEDLGATLFVEASAGTGKTTSLVQRVTNLVATGTTTLDRVAAITFTEAAAAELRDRVRAELEKVSGDDRRDQAERDRCHQGIADLDQADICTLHSFAGGLLRERPLEAGLPPSFETSDEILAGIKFEEQWRDWLDRHLDGETDLAPHLALALTLGLTLNHLRTIARAFHQNYSDLLDVSFHAPAPAPSAALAAIIDAVPAMERLCGFSKEIPGDALYAHVMNNLRLLWPLPKTATSLLDGYRILLELRPRNADGSPVSIRSRGSTSNWDRDPDSRENACTVLKSTLATFVSRGWRGNPKRPPHGLDAHS